MRKFLKDFKAFALKGNVMDLAVGVMIGGAFGKIVTSLVGDIFMPLLSLITGRIDLGSAFYALDGKAYPSIDAAKAAGVATLNYGLFFSTVIDFLLISWCIFLFVRLMTQLMPHKPAAPAVQPRLCPYCKGEIHAEATRCPHCTSTL
ncbi:MAG: large conductance mechanosensitive channel protein MscL [Clostridia bacterium]